MGMAGDTDIRPGSALQQQLTGCAEQVTEAICGQQHLKRHT
jgi:hypothetical protein